MSGNRRNNEPPTTPAKQRKVQSNSIILQPKTPLSNDSPLKKLSSDTPSTSNAGQQSSKTSVASMQDMLPSIPVEFYESESEVESTCSSVSELQFGDHVENLLNEVDEGAETSDTDCDDGIVEGEDSNLQFEVSSAEESASTVFHSYRNPDFAQIVINGVLSGTYKQCPIIKSVSKVHEHAYVIIDIAENTTIGYVCRICRRLFAKRGGSLTKHLNQCIATIDDQHRPNFTVPEKKEIQFKQCIATAIDKVSMGGYKKAGAVALMQEIADISYHTGIVDGMANNRRNPPSVANALISRKAVRNRINKTVILNLDKFRQKVQELVADGCALVLDTTPNEHHYVGYIVHYLDKRFRPRRIVSRLNEFKERSVATAVWNDAKSVLDDLGIDSASVHYVGDGASNNKSAFSGRRFIICACHNIHLVVKHLTKPYVCSKKVVAPATVTACGTFDITLKKLKKVVSYVCKEKKALNRTLSKKLINDVDVRWLTKYQSVKRFCDLKPDDHRLLKEGISKKEISDLLDEVTCEKENLKSWIDVVQPFEKALRTCEAEGDITLNRVVPVMFELAKDLARDNISYKRKEWLTRSHFFATALDPRYHATLEKMTGDKYSGFKAEFIKEAHDLIDALPEPEMDDNPWGVPDVDKYAQLYEYLRVKVNNVNFDLSEWWATNEERFPVVAKLARIYLATPASSASVERLFSKLSLMKRDKPKLLPENVNMMILFETMLDNLNIQTI